MTQPTFMPGPWLTEQDGVDILDTLTMRANELRRTPGAAGDAELARIEALTKRYSDWVLGACSRAPAGATGTPAPAAAQPAPALSDERVMRGEREWWQARPQECERMIEASVPMQRWLCFEAGARWREHEGTAGRVSPNMSASKPLLTAVQDLLARVQRRGESLDDMAERLSRLVRRGMTVDHVPATVVQALLQAMRQELQQTAENASSAAQKLLVAGQPGLSALDHLRAVFEAIQQLPVPQVEPDAAAPWPAAAVGCVKGFERAKRVAVGVVLDQMKVATAAFTVPSPPRLSLAEIASLLNLGPNAWLMDTLKVAYAKADPAAATTTAPS